MTRPELTVFMRVGPDDAAPADALASVLRQEGVDFEIVACAPEEVWVAGSEQVANSRVRMPGEPADIRSPFVAEVPASCFLFPGALRMLLDACAAGAEVGMASCYFLSADEAGRVVRAEHHVRHRNLVPRLGPVSDVRRTLLAHGDVVGQVRVFRREAFEATGYAVGDRRMAPDFET